MLKNPLQFLAGGMQIKKAQLFPTAPYCLYKKEMTLDRCII